MVVNNTFLTEDEYYDNLKMQVLDEGFLGTILKGAATLLGYSGLAIFAGFGAAMLAKSAVSKEGKINRFFRRIFGNKKNLDFDAVKGRAVVKREEDKAKAAQARFPEVFKAIEMGDWDEAERLFKNSEYTDNPEMVKAVAMAICDKVGEPPLFVYPSGNEAYFKCKKIVGMKYAKAITQAVLAAMKQKKSYVSIADTDIDNI